MYSVKYHKQVLKFLQKQDKKVKKDIVDFFELIKSDPYDFKGHDVKSFKGYENRYRLRIRKYRVIFSIVDEALVVEVIKAGSRGDVYK
jgi:mRNA interferase RelE/StbE